MHPDGIDDFEVQMHLTFYKDGHIEYSGGSFGITDFWESLRAQFLVDLLCVIAA